VQPGGGGGAGGGGGGGGGSGSSAVTHLFGRGDEDEHDELGDTVDEDDLGVPFSSSFYWAALPAGRKAQVRIAYGRDGNVVYWSVKMPQSAGMDKESKDAECEALCRQMENLVDSIQEGVWRKGRCAQGKGKGREQPKSVSHWQRVELSP